MTRFLRTFSIFLALAATCAAQTVITSISGATAPRSGRLLIQGSGFGAAQGTGHVEIGGIAAPVTRWSDTLIAAYVPEGAPLGTVDVQVAAPGGASSNLVPLTVTLRPPADGRIRWRFQADAEYIESRPAIGPDGTVYTIDMNGNLYALSPDGALKWIFNATGTGFGNVTVGPDGSVYTGSTDAIFALAPDGSLKWKFDQSPPAMILLGPDAGPDGNIYAVGTQGMGVFSLTPEGRLRWSSPENYDRPIVTLQEIVFGPLAQSRLYFHANRHLRGLTLDGSPVFTYADALYMGDNQLAVAPDGSVYSNLFDARGPGLLLGKFDNDGNLIWRIFDRFTTSTNVLSTPDVGPDGVVYDGRNLISLLAVNPDSSVRWQYVDSGILFEPAVSPLNDLIFVGGELDFGQAGFFAAVSTSGVLLWKVTLPIENGLDIIPMSRARFTPDGQTVYIGTSIAGQAADGYCYLYSVQTGSSPVPTAVALSALSLSPGTVKGGASSQGTVTLTGPAPATGVRVNLASSNTAVSTVPSGITVPAGATSAVFTVQTKRVRSNTSVTISATAGNVTKTATLTVRR